MRKVTPDSILESLDERQREVAVSLRGPVRVLAGAGTGKTRAMTHRIAYGVLTGEYAPENILAVTFTSKAAGEMRVRLRHLGITNVNARTFHSEALSELGTYWPKLVKRPTPEIIDNKIPLVKTAIESLKLQARPTRIREVCSVIEWAKVSLVSHLDYAEVAESENRPLKGDVSHIVMADIMCEYEKLKAINNVVDFDDCLLLMAYMISENDWLANTIRQKYRYFMVDEYQDISPVQQFLLEKWLSGRSDLCVVGDPSQTIYSFAGATPYYLLDFANKFECAKTVELAKDYRSTQKIVHLANKTLQKREITQFSQLNLFSARDENYKITYLKCGSEEEEAGVVADKIEELLGGESGFGEVKKSDIAILYRQNAQRTQFQNALELRKINSVSYPNTRFFDKPYVKEIIKLLKTESLVQNESESFVDVVRRILIDYGYSANEPADTIEQKEKWVHLKAFYNMALDWEREINAIDSGSSFEEMEAKNSADKNPILAFLRYVEERRSNQADPVLDAVTLSSLHAAKGLEWKIVFLVGVYDGVLPSSLCLAGESLEEERRLLYVGITRAKDLLYISYSQSRYQNTKKTRNRSRFLDGLWGVV